MQTILILLSLFLSSLALANDFTDGLVLIRKKQYKEGIKLIEKAFQNETNKEKKAKISRVLALSDHNFLKNSPEYYSKYALKFSKDLTDKEKFELHRKLGDFYLKSGQFKNSKNQFQTIIKNLNPTHPLHEYAIYNLGWVEVNLGKYLDALRLWTKYVQSQKYTKILLESILIDLGKIWYEYYYKKGREFPLKDISVNHIEHIEKGVRNSVKKESISFTHKTKSLLPLNKTLKHAVADELIKLHPKFIKNHCEVFKFIQQNSVINLDTKYLVNKGVSCLLNSKLNKFVVSYFQNLPSSTLTNSILGLILIQKKKYTEGCTITQKYLQAYRKKEELSNNILTIFLRSCLGQEAFLRFLHESKKDENFYSLSLAHLRQLFIDKEIVLLEQHLESLDSTIKPHIRYMANIWLKRSIEPTEWSSKLCNYYNSDDVHTIALYHINSGKLHVFGNKDCLDASLKQNKLLAESLAINVLNSKNNMFAQKADHWANTLYQLINGDAKGYDEKLKTVLKGTKLLKQLSLINDLSKRKERYKKFRKTKIPNLFKELQWFSKKAKNTKWKSATLALRAQALLNQFITEYQQRIKVFKLNQEAFKKLKDASDSLRLQL